MKLHNILLSYLFLLVSCSGESLGEEIDPTINCAEGYYLKPHPYDCGDYYLCTSYGPKKMTCPIGKAFDQIRYTCLPKNQAICKIEHDVSEDNQTSAMTPSQDFISSHQPENEITTITSIVPILTSTTTAKDIRSSLMPAREMNETSIPSIETTTLHVTSSLSETAITKNFTTPTTIKSQPTISEIFTSPSHYHINNVTNSLTTFQMYPSSTTRNIASFSTNTTYTPTQLQSDITNAENFTSPHYDTINYNSTVTESYPSQEDKIIFTHQPTNETNYTSTVNQSQTTNYKNFTSTSPSYNITNIIYTSTTVKSYPSIARNVTLSHQPTDPTNYTSTVNQTNPITGEITSPSYTTNDSTYISTVGESYSSQAEKTVHPQQPTNATSYTSTVNKTNPITGEITSPSYTTNASTYISTVGESYSSQADKTVHPQQPTNATSYTSTVNQTNPITGEITSPSYTTNASTYISTVGESYSSQAHTTVLPQQPTNATSYTSTIHQVYPSNTENFTSPSHHTTDSTIYNPTISESYTSIATNFTSPNQAISDKNYTSTVHQPYSTIAENITSPYYHSTNTTTHISELVETSPSLSEKIVSPYQPTNSLSFTSVAYKPYPTNAEHLTPSQTYTSSTSTSPFIAQNVTTSDQPTNATSYTSTVIESHPTTTEIKSPQYLPTANTTYTTSTTDEFMKNISSSDQQRETVTFSFTVNEPNPTMGQNKTLSTSYQKTNATVYIPTQAQSYFSEVKTTTNSYHSENPANSTVIQSHLTTVENFRNNTQIYILSTKPTELTPNSNNLEISELHDPTTETVTHPISSKFQSFPSTADFLTDFHTVNKIINTSKPLSSNDENLPIPTINLRTNKTKVSQHSTTSSNFSSFVYHLNNDTIEQSSTIISQSQPITSQYNTPLPYQSNSVTKIHMPSTNKPDKTSTQLIQTQDKSTVTIPSILPLLSNSLINSTMSALSQYKLVFVKLAELLFVQ